MQTHVFCACIKRRGNVGESELGRRRASNADLLFLGAAGSASLQILHDCCRFCTTTAISARQARNLHAASVDLVGFATFGTRDRRSTGRWSGDGRPLYDRRRTCSATRLSSATFCPFSSRLETALECTQCDYAASQARHERRARALLLPAPSWGSIGRLIGSPGGFGDASTRVVQRRRVRGRAQRVGWLQRPRKE